jgi:peptidoglycan/xylan/chitin deacetylase (PgdA/CDA1 family)
VAVIPGVQYTFSYAYNANIPSNVTVRYLKTDGTYLYSSVANHAASGGWMSNSVTIEPPADVQAMTVMHIIYAVGEMSIDEYSLVSGNSNTFNNGMVTFSFDDGWAEHASIGAPMLEAAGYEGTFYLISDELTNNSVSNLIQNGNLETGGITPTNWKQGGWGTNTREFTYPAVGATGSGATVAITSYTSGDAKWYFDDVAVSGDVQYMLSTAYMSTIESAMVLRYTLSGGGTTYTYLDTLPSTDGTWNTYSKTVIAPSDAVSVTAFHLINGVGELTVDDYALSSDAASFYVSLEAALAMQAAGHEIGGHTLAHTSLTGLDTAGKIAEVAGSRDNLLSAGFSPVASFAYPYGDYNDEVKTVVAEAGFSSGRSVDRGFNDKATDVYALKIQQVGRNASVADINAWINQADQSNTWLILMFHQINDDSAATLGTTNSELQSVIDYTRTTGIDVVTVAQGRALMN